MKLGRDLVEARRGSGGDSLNRLAPIQDVISGKDMREFWSH